MSRRLEERRAPGDADPGQDERADCYSGCGEQTPRSGFQCDAADKYQGRQRDVHQHRRSVADRAVVAPICLRLAEPVFEFPSLTTNHANIPATVNPAAAATTRAE